MSIYAVGNLKGGVGKTTLSLNLAISLANAGRDVLLIDAEKTAVDATALRIHLHGTAGYTAVQLQGSAIRTQARQLAPKYDDIVIDIGGEDATGSLRAALLVANILLMPVKPRTFDLWRMQQTAALVAEAGEINEKLRAVVILNEADPSGQDNAGTLEAIQGTSGVETAPVQIGRRKAFPNALSAGLSVIEYGKDPKAAAEMQQLVDFLTASNKRVTNDKGVYAYGSR